MLHYQTVDSLVGARIMSNSRMEMDTNNERLAQKVVDWIG